MKKIILFCLFIFVVFKSNSQSSDNPIYTEITSINYKYKIDTLKWHLQSNNRFLSYMKDSLKLGIDIKDGDQIIAAYALNSNCLTQPLIIIAEFKTAESFPGYNQIERELKAKSVPEYVNNKKTIYNLNNIDLLCPVIIREKDLIIQEVFCYYIDYKELYARSGMFIKKNKFINIQITYVKGMHDDALKDFNIIIDSMKFLN